MKTSSHRYRQVYGILKIGKPGDRGEKNKYLYGMEYYLQNK